MTDSMIDFIDILGRQHPDRRRPGGQCAGAQGRTTDSYLPVIVLTAQPGHKLRACRRAPKTSSASRLTWWR
jgi:hypothetical protein